MLFGKQVCKFYISDFLRYGPEKGGVTDGRTDGRTYTEPRPIYVSRRGRHIITRKLGSNPYPDHIPEADYVNRFADFFQNQDSENNRLVSWNKSNYDNKLSFRF